MPELKRIRFWFMILSIQMIFAAAVPTAILMLLPARETTLTLELPGLVLNDLPPQEASEEVEAFFKSIVSEGTIIFEAQDGQIRIPYASIGLQFDTAEITQGLQKGQYQNRFFQLVGKTDLSCGKAAAVPYINEALFSEAFSRISEMYHVDALDAGLVLHQGSISVTPHSKGREFDVLKALDYVTGQLQAYPNQELILSESLTPGLFTATEPEITTEMLQSFTQVYSLTQGSIPDGKTEAFHHLVLSLDNILIKSGGSFSFRESISSFKETDPLQQLLASCIYRAILPVEDIRIISRKSAGQPVPGIEPGFEVNLENDGDLQFKNTADMPLMLVFEIDESGSFTAALAAKPGLSIGTVRTEYTKIQPSIIYSQENTLPVNAKEVMEPGKEGLSVKVYRIMGNEPIKLYEDVYQPVHKIIAVGTGIKKEDLVQK